MNQKLERKVGNTAGIVGICGMFLAPYAGAAGLITPEVSLIGLETGIALTALGILAILHSKRIKK